MAGMKHHTFCYSSLTKTNKPTYQPTNQKANMHKDICILQSIYGLMGCWADNM